jgi:TfoX/Sxy family transcriptional regulator of competence genes
MMAFDGDLAARVREVLDRVRGVEERRMFGSLCFLLNGNLLVGVWQDALIARLGPDQAAEALREPHVRRFDVTGKPMKGWVLVGPEGVEDDARLRDWVDRATEFVATLPPK